MPIDAPAECPSCRQPMSRLELPRKLVGQATLDLCFACQGIWFDENESLQLAPRGVLDLFRTIREHRDDPINPLAGRLACPRCSGPLQPVRDIVRSGRFTYHRCAEGHGRFTLFGQFMIEKGFVRQLAPAEVQALAARVGSIRCSGCGAPVDIRREDACGHCGAPIAILDPQAVDRALAEFARRPLPAEAQEPTAVADALLAARARRAPASVSDGGRAGDLLIAGLDLLLGAFD